MSDLDWAPDTGYRDPFADAPGDDGLSPRHDAQAEASVIGAVLASNGKALADCAELRPEDFYRPAHETLWRLILDQHNTGQPVEPVAVAARLTEQDVRVSRDYIHDCLTLCSNWRSAGYYARQISTLARLRRGQDAARQMLRTFSQVTLAEADQAIEQTRSTHDQAVAKHESRRASDWDDITLRLLDELAEPAETVLSTGLPDVDDMFGGGLKPGRLTIIGARPGVGKSVAASVIAANVARKGFGVVWASLEMGATEVAMRIAASQTGISLERLERKRLTNSDWEKLRNWRQRTSGWSMRINDESQLGLTQLRSDARDLAHTPTGLSLIIVDYAQLMSPPMAGRARHEEVAAISRGLKALAKDFNVPVVALAQVSRAVMDRADKRAQLSDLKESGQLEQDADVVIMLNRDEKERPTDIDFDFVKNRQGRKGTVTLEWIGWLARISSIGGPAAEAGR